MKRLDQLRLDISADAVPVLCPVRNELQLVPHFVAHYRKMGVRQIVFIDNMSNDGTTEFLLEQPDCVVFQTDESYAASNFAVNWVNRLIDEHFRARWVVHADCDELLVYPSMEERPIQSLCADLSREKADTLFAVMIDTYPEGDFRNLKIQADDDLYAKVGCFDADYVFREFPQRPWDPKPATFRLEVLGGPKWRLIPQLDLNHPSGEVHDTLFNVLGRAVRHLPRRLVPLLARLLPIHRPSQHKQPLNFAQPRMRYLNSHTTTNKQLSRTNVALLHMKFSSGLAKRFELSRVEGQHYLRGLPDEQFRAAVSRLSAQASLFYHGSQRYTCSEDLTKLGLIGETISRLWREDGVTRVRCPI